MEVARKAASGAPAIGLVGACAAAWISPRAKATALSSFGIRNRCASMIAMAAMTTARPAPSQPRRSGAMQTLAATAAMARPGVVRSVVLRSAQERCRAASNLSVVRTKSIPASVRDAGSAKLSRQRAARRRRTGGSAHFRPQLLGDEMRVDVVADDLRADEDDQLGPQRAVGPVREGGAKRARQLIEHGDAGRTALLALADQSGKKHRLPAGDRYRALDAALRHRRRQRRAALCRRDVADLLLDVEPDIAIDVDARNDAENDARVAVIDGVDDRVAGRQHGRAAGRHRDLVADLQR